MKNISVKNKISGAISLSFLLAYLIPIPNIKSNVGDFTSFVGVLFAVLVGFFLAHLYSRYQLIRSNAGIDASSLSTFYVFATLLASETGDKEWLRKVADTIESYVHFFMPLKWEDYGETEKYFNDLCMVLREIKNIPNERVRFLYNNLLKVVSGHSTAREKLVMAGKDRLPTGGWITILFLTLLLFTTVLFSSDGYFVSRLFIGGVFSATLTLLIVIRDLDNLNFGETSVTIEPYERVLDTLGRERYYREKK